MINIENKIEQKEEVVVSAFVLTTNSIKGEYPFIESIKSWSEAVDEIVVVDGGSTDGTVEAIQALEDPKIRIISDEDTRWEDEWFYARMGHNFTRGLEECTGDVVIKFDADYVLHERSYRIHINKRTVRDDAQWIFDSDFHSLSFNRRNFILIDRYFYKTKKTLGVNKTLLKSKGINLKYGLDIDNWGWGFDFIDGKYEENGIWFGDMIRKTEKDYICCADVFNYDYSLMSKECCYRSRRRHFLAVTKQKHLLYKGEPLSKILIAEHTKSSDWIKINSNFPMDIHIESCKGYITHGQTILPYQAHPNLMHTKVRNIKSNQFGYDGLGTMKDFAEEKYKRKINPNTFGYWNDFYKQERFQKRHSWRIKPYTKITEIVDFKSFKNLTVYDLGCAFGDGLHYLSSVSPQNKYIGIDYSEECIKWAKNKSKLHPNLSFSIEAIENFKQRDKVDIIILAETLEHLDNDMQIVEMLRTKCKMLIVAVPYNEALKNPKLHDMHVNNYTEQSFREAYNFIHDGDYLISVFVQEDMGEWIINGEKNKHLISKSYESVA